MRLTSINILNFITVSPKPKNAPFQSRFFDFTSSFLARSLALQFPLSLLVELQTLFFFC